LEHVLSLLSRQSGQAEPKIREEETRLILLKRFVFGLMTVEPRPSSFFDTLCRHNGELANRVRELQKELEPVNYVHDQVEEVEEEDDDCSIPKTKRRDRSKVNLKQRHDQTCLL
jgi:hypothetical protein